MGSPDEEIPGQILDGCGSVILVVAVCLAAFVGLIAIIVHFVK